MRILSDSATRELMRMQTEAALDPKRHEESRQIGHLISYYERLHPGYNLLEHFTISYNNLKTAAIGFATAVATLAQFQ